MSSALSSALRSFSLGCFALALVSACGRVGPQSAEHALKRPDVLLVWVDDLGALDTGVYGSPLYETPAQRPGEVARLRGQLEALRSSVGAEMPTPNPDWPAADR